MLTITTAGRARLTELLAGSPARGTGRIVRSGNHLKLRRGEARPGDDSIEHEGRTLLLLDMPVSKRLNDRVLDVRQTTSGPKLSFSRRPDAQED